NARSGRTLKIRVAPFSCFLSFPEHQKMCEALTKGDEVVTVGGMAGRIADVSEQYIVIEISNVDGKPVTLTLQRAAVQTVLPKGTLKSI
ncbi:MAG: preprotein translocase subunit YajC, partial [Duodenibacillus sp.]|nr:preprotein translocase subunit YajC [Duodenibacillus sp.]